MRRTFKAFRHALDRSDGSRQALARHYRTGGAMCSRVKRRRPSSRGASLRTFESVKAMDCSSELSNAEHEQNATRRTNRIIRDSRRPSELGLAGARAIRRNLCYPREYQTENEPR
jgi:hypothetical protein